MFWTGLCLWGETMNVPAFAATTTLVGGAMSMRIIHYYGMFVFIIFMFIHIYLANVESTPPRSCSSTRNTVVWSMIRTSTTSWARTWILRLTNSQGSGLKASGDLRVAAFA